MEMRRLTRGEQARILAAAGVLDLSRDTPYEEKVKAVTMAARLVSGSYINDVAIIYAAVINHFESIDAEPLWITEDLFFDTITREVASGKIAEEEGTRFREGNREVAEGPGFRGRAESYRDTRGKQRRRFAEVAQPVLGPSVLPDEDPGEAHEGALGLEGDGPGASFPPIPF